LPANESWSQPIAARLPLPRTRRTSDPPPLPASRGTAKGPAAVAVEQGAAPATAPQDAAPARAGGDGPTEVERAPLRAPRRWMIYAAGAAGILLGVATAGVIVARSNDGAAELFPHAPAAASPSAPSPSAPSAVAPAAVAVGESPGSTEPEPEPEPEPEIEPDVEPVDPPVTGGDGNAHTRVAASLAAATTSEPVNRPSRRHGPSRAAAARSTGDRLSADELFKEGVQAFMRGDPRAAIALCKRATQASPGFGPAWRLMGVVHERLGEKSGARAAFEKYLQVSPGAGDADDIRHRLGAL